MDDAEAAVGVPAHAGTELLAAVGRVRRRAAVRLWLRQAGAALVAAAVPLAVSALVIAATGPAGLPLLLVVGAGLVLAGAAGAGVVLRGRTPDQRQVARYIEERTDGLAGDAGAGDALVTAVEVATGKGETASPFAPLLIARAAQRLRTIEPSQVVPTSALIRAAVAAAAGGVFAAASAGALAPSVRDAGAVLLGMAAPGSIALSVTPGSVSVREGTPLTLRAVAGAGGAHVAAPPVLRLTEAGETRELAMRPAGGGFEYRIPAVVRTFSYGVRAGRASSPDYTVTALVPPRVERLDLRYVYPAFTGLAPREEPGGGDIHAPAGTRVRIRIRADRPLRTGSLRLRDGRRVAAAEAGDGTMEAEVVVARDDSYRVSVEDRSGMVSRGGSEYFIRVMDDRPPDIRIVRPGTDRQVTPLEEVPIETTADDDYGVASMELVYAVGGTPPRVLPFAQVTGTHVEKTGRALLAVEDLRVAPGDVVSYYARAREVARGGRARVATSDLFFLEVQPFGGEFVGARSQAMGQGGGGGLEGLVEGQKQIIAATWNLERRAAAGRSDGDLRAVAEAQEGLKSRAEEAAAGPARRPGGGRRGAAPDTGATAVAEAAAAMGAAAVELRAGRTGAAVPHEMAALNALLRAQADVRRRQVAQQQAAGGNAGNRAGEDLSALFDRELQRQQQTNYETPSSIEPRDDRRPDAALIERLRELARRQEDLGRRQEAAAAGTDEGRRRELERLTREQAELRQQAEALARQVAGRPGARALQGAVDRMRTAGGDLERGRPGAAAGSAAEAAAELRRAGQQAAGGRAEEGRTAAAGETEARSRELARALEQTRVIRDRLRRLDEQLRGPGRSGPPANGGPRGAGQEPRGAEDGTGGAGAAASRGGEDPAGEYRRALEDARRALERLEGGQPASTGRGATPAAEEFSRGAPGTEAFKQDRTGWESLRKDLDLALERYEAAVSARLAGRGADHRLSAGSGEGVPEAFSAAIARYFEALAREPEGRR